MIPPTCVVIDVRAVDEQLRNGAVDVGHSFPAADLDRLAFALPPRSRPLAVILTDDKDCVETQQAEIASKLTRLGYCSYSFFRFSAACANRPIGPTENNSKRCWEPCPLLQREIDRIETSVGGQGVCVDLGCGCGRDMAFLAMRGWAVAGFDNRKKLVQQSSILASRHSCSERFGSFVAHVSTSLPFRALCADLVLVVRFLHRPTVGKIFGLVAPGGFLLYSHFLDGCQDTDVGTPSTIEGFFLRGELEAKCVESGLAIVLAEETRLEDGRPMINVLCHRLPSVRTSCS